MNNGKAFDLPHLKPPDSALEIASDELTCDQGLLLLEWIKNLRSQTYYCEMTRRLKKYEIPARFLESIRRGKWLKTYTGFKSPKRCYLCGEIENKTILDLGSAMGVLSAIDEPYFSNTIRSYKDELIFIGVQIRDEDISNLIVRSVVHLASSKMSVKLVFLVLYFLR